MKIRLAENDDGELNLYRIAFVAKGHDTVLTPDGKECVNEYKTALAKLTGPGQTPSENQPLDALVLDYRMPVLDGLGASKEILRLNKKQRIVFASWYVKDILAESVTQFEHVLELIQKPFEPKVLVALIEDTATPAALYEINRMIGDFDPYKPHYKQIEQLLDVLGEYRKLAYLETPFHSYLIRSENPNHPYFSQ